MSEIDLIQQCSPSYKYYKYDDMAKGHVAFALDVCREETDEQVSKLNSREDGDWYLGDENEEYVSVRWKHFIENKKS